MSMDLCYIDQNEDVQSLLNMSNSNWSHFTHFVYSTLCAHVTVCTEIADSQDLTATGDNDYDAWKREEAANEVANLVFAENLATRWETETCNISDVLQAMSVAMLDPNAAQYMGYISRITSASAKALAVGNPRTYWA